MGYVIKNGRSGMYLRSYNGSQAFWTTSQTKAMRLGSKEDAANTMNGWVLKAVVVRIRRKVQR